MSDVYEEYDPSSLSNEQMPTQHSTSKEQGPKEKLENKKSAEQPAFKKTISPKDSESNTYEYVQQYLPLEETNYLLEKTYAYDEVNVRERTSSWKDRNQEVEEDYGYENIYEDTDLDTHSSDLLPQFGLRNTSLRESLLNAVKEPSSSLKSKDGLYSKEEGTQTEWVDESSKLEIKPVKWSSSYKVLLSVIKSSSKEDIATDLSGETQEKQEIKEKEDVTETVEDHKEEPKESPENENTEDYNIDDDLWKDYHSELADIIYEMKEHKELDGNVDISMIDNLEPQVRKKLGFLLTKSYESNKESIKGVIQKHKDTIRVSRSVFEFRLSLTQSQMTQTVDLEKKVEEEWIQETKVPHGVWKITLYPGDKSIFQILFPDGSGQIYYPSGNPAMLMVGLHKKKMLYIILEDNEESTIRGLVNNTGHATFYDDEENIWVNLSPRLGFYFPKDKPAKAWNWWDLSVHVHAPPVQSISLRVNSHIKVRIKSQGHISFCFTHQKQRVCLNLGTKYKPLAPEVLSKLKGKPVLEVEASPLAQKIQILLGKISKILSLTSAAHLWAFVSAHQELYVGHKWVSMPSVLSLLSDTQETEQSGGQP